MSSGHPVMMVSAKEQRSGSSLIDCWKAIFFSGMMCTWWIARSRAISGAGIGAYRDRVSATSISLPGL